VSATNRGGKRLPDDYYQTPQHTIDEFLDGWLARDPDALKGLILDPCAGGTVDGETMAYPEALERRGIFGTLTNDIRGDSPAWKHQDFLKDYEDDPPAMCLKWYGCDLIISNPPFCVARKFIERALRAIDPGGRVAFLLRLSYLASQKRRPWWCDRMPRYIFVHSRRPSFTGKGADACDYAHFVWYRDDLPRNHSEVHIV
jgi:hypothetical protein